MKIVELSKEYLVLPFVLKNRFKLETSCLNIKVALSYALHEISKRSHFTKAYWGNETTETDYIHILSYRIDGFLKLLISNIPLHAKMESSITNGQDILLSAGVSFRVPN